MLPSFFWRDVGFYFVAVKNHPDLITVVDCGKAKYGGNFGDDIFFSAIPRSEHCTCTDVNQKHYGKFALFFKHLTVRMTKPRRNVPVDEPHIISMRVFSHFFKRHSLALESAVIFASKKV